MKDLTWEEAADGRFIGRDLKARESVLVYRGPIQLISFEDGMVRIRLQWSAIPTGDGWTYIDLDNLIESGEEYASIRAEEDGSFSLGFMYISGDFCILPEGDNLNPEDVLGLLH